MTKIRTNISRRSAASRGLATSSGLTSLMEKEYESIHPGPPPKTELAGRWVLDDGGLGLRIFMAEKRQEYIKNQSIIKNPSIINPQGDGSKPCCLCRSSSGIVYENQLLIRPDPFPMYQYHMQIIPLISELARDQFNCTPENRYKKGWVDVNLIDCRRHPTFEDLKSEMSLVKNSDYLIMQSMEGSGASVPNHIHSHAFKKDIMKFPLLSKDRVEKDRAEIFNDGRSTIHRLPWPSYGFVFRAEEPIVAYLVNRLREKYGAPFNFLESQDQKGIFGVYVPRCMEVPSNPLFKDWQFGVTEVLGLFEAKTRDQFDRLTARMLIDAVKEVTIQDPDQQKGIEQFLLSVVRGL